MRWFPIMAAMLLAACSSFETRLREDPSAVAGLDERTLARVRRREIAVGDSEAIVRLALGRPLRTAPLADGGAMWFYRDRPRDPNDYIAGGFRYRVVFDPVKRGNTTTIEPVDARLFPNLRTHLIRVSIRDGRVSALKIEEDY